ncbi:MAG: large conductance mechanosensitive channel protein MscL [Candidatus Obscuribacterales bacterium]|nr:large conductance mechanosensitive channel protein MscL [Candidatus Obscuribacterales bacterium]
MLKDFVSFLTKANALALAIGVIIGGATGKLVSAVVDDTLMPCVGLIMPAGDWREAQIVLSQSTDATGKITVNALKYGHLLGAMLDFVIIAFVVYVITKALLPKEPPPPATKSCSECLEVIPLAARKCRACTTVC